MTAWVVTARERGAELAERLRAWFGRGASAVGITDQLRAARPAGGPDRLLCGAALTLTAFGAVMVFSAGAAFAAKTYGDWTFFLKREAIYGVLGLVAFVFAMRTDYSVYRRLTYPLLFFALALLVGVLLVGTRVGGAVR